MKVASTLTSFEKWEGLGNDFIVIGSGGEDRPWPSLARELCDRRRGVGADGVLVVEAPSGGPPRMTVYNADGSRPEMCGNGLRCVAGFLESEYAPSAAPRELVIATDAGEKRCLIRRVAEGLYDVEVDMGVARIEEPLRITADRREHSFLMVDVGNPHAITFEAYEQDEIDRIGPAAATTPAGGTNVEFCRIREGHSGTSIEVIVWERGVGRTLACGTGACAVAAAACATGRASYGTPIVISLPGGDLEITVGADRRDLRMRGPARRVFTGELAGT